MRATLLSFLVFCFLSAPTQCNDSVKLTGDFILGGLFPIHQKMESGSECSLKFYDRGMHRLEAMLFAVDRINSESGLLPSINLGVNILDTCSRDTYALNQSLEFIRASMQNIDHADFVCDDRSEPRPKFQHLAVTGVIGGSYSSVSIQVANLLRLFHIPLVRACHLHFPTEQ